MQIQTFCVPLNLTIIKNKIFIFTYTYTSILIYMKPNRLFRPQYVAYRLPEICGDDVVGRKKACGGGGTGICSCTVIIGVGVGCGVKHTKQNHVLDIGT